MVVVQYTITLSVLHSGWVEQMMLCGDRVSLES